MSELPTLRRPEEAFVVQRPAYKLNVMSDKPAGWPAEGKARL